MARKAHLAEMDDSQLARYNVRLRTELVAVLAELELRKPESAPEPDHSESRVQLAFDSIWEAGNS